MVLHIVFLTIGILLLIESIIVLLFPNWTTKTRRVLVKNIKNVKKAGIVELIIAIILILIGMNI
ncbi:hypothetical protein ES703_103273 [subsurface metagenome]